MHQETVSISMEQIVTSFGIIISFLLAILAFFLRMLVMEFQDFKKSVTTLKVDVARLNEKVFDK